MSKIVDMEVNYALYIRRRVGAVRCEMESSCPGADWIVGTTAVTRRLALTMIWFAAQLGRGHTLELDNIETKKRLIPSNLSVCCATVLQ